MSNWRTLRQDLVEETRASADEKNIDRAIVQALKWHKTFHCYFNEKVTTISTVVSQEQYDLPSDFVERVGRVYFIHSGSQSKIPMEVTTWDWMESWRNRFGADEFSNQIQGFPRICAIKPKDSYAGLAEIYVGPTPAVAGDSIVIRYVADLGTPTIDFTPDYGWRVLDPDGTSTLDPTWETRWLQEGYEAIRAYAKYLYHLKYTKDEDEKTAGQTEWQAELSNIRRITTRSRKPEKVRAYVRSN